MRRVWLLAGALALGCAHSAPPDDAAAGGIMVEAEMYPVAPHGARISWHDSLDAAKAASRADGKPIMLFFEFDA
ncbi:MAG: hypothetical protein ACYTGX_02435 [Planctomycetota bacterium]|jgi:hypothetical protein